MAINFSAPFTFRPRRSSASGLTPEEEQSLLESLGSSTLSGIGWLGETLDKPGSAVRGMLSGLTGGDWGGGLLNLIPFSDTLGITSPEKKVTGRELLEGWDWLDPNQKGFDAGDVGGFAAEVALDPLTYLTLGASALGKGGQVAKRMGLLDDVAKQASKRAGTKVGRRVAQMETKLGDVLQGTNRLPEASLIAKGMNLNIDDLLGQPLGGLGGIGVPFMSPSKVFGKGAGARKVAGVMDDIGEAVRFGKYSPVPLVAANFSRAMKGVTKPFAQKATGPASKVQGAGEAAVRQRMAGYIHDLDELGLMDESAQAWKTRPFFEGITDELPANFETPQARAILRAMKDDMARVLPEEQAAGLGTRQLQDVKNLGDEIPEYPDLPPQPIPPLQLEDQLPGTIEDYFPRQLYQHARPQGPRSASAAALSTTMPYQFQREELLRGWRAGTDPLNTASLDSAVSGKWHEWEQSTRKMTAPQRKTVHEAKLATATKHIRETYPELAATADALENGDEVLTSLTDWLSKLDPQYVQKGIPAFGRHPVYDMLSRLEHGEAAKGGARAIYDMIGQQGGHFGAVSGQAGKPVKVTHLLQEVGLTGSGAHKQVADAFDTQLLPDRLGRTRPSVDNMYVSSEVADQIRRVMKPFSAPDEINTLVKAWDKATNLMRTHFTIPWPAFHARNHLSGMTQNVLGGAIPLHRLGDAYTDTWNLARAKAVKGAENIPDIKAAGITEPMQASRQLADEVFSHGLASGRQGQVFGEIGEIPGQIDDVLHEIPGLRKPKGLVKRVGQFMPKGIRDPDLWKAWRTRGVTGPTTEWLPARFGEDVAQATEYYNRVAPYIALRKQGYAPAVAAKRVKDLQVDYMAGAAGDKVMRRIFPFFSFAKGMFAFTGKELWQKPGGALAQTIRMQNRSRGKGQLLPDYLSRTLSIDLPPGESGDPRLLTGFGLMHEDPASFLGGGLRGGLQELGSRSNPLLKAPLEWMTGESFFQAGPRGGRALDQMDPGVGRLAANLVGRDEPFKLGGLLEHGLSNSPLSRYLSSARGLTDTRKGLGAKATNLFTGARVTDIPPRVQDRVISDALDNLLMETGVARTFEKTYVPKDTLAKLPPAQRAELKRYLALQTLLGQRKRQRGKGLPLEALGL